MTEKELRASRNKSQSITNILSKGFEFKWDWIDYNIKKWETQNHPFFLAEHAAFHMARKHCLEENINFTKEWGKIVDEILGKTFIEYNKLTKVQALNLAKDRKIKTENDNWEEKTKKEIVEELKATH